MRRGYKDSIQRVLTQTGARTFGWFAGALASMGLGTYAYMSESWIFLPIFLLTSVYSWIQVGRLERDGEILLAQLKMME